MSDQYTRNLLQTVTGRTARYTVTPAVSGVPAVGVVLTTGAGAWGVYADLIAAAAILTEHWLCAFFLSIAGVAQIFEVQVRDATPVSLFEFVVDPTAVTVNLGQIFPPFPIWRPGSAQTQARAGGAAAKVISVKTLVGLGL